MQKDKKMEILECKLDEGGRLVDVLGKFLFDNNGNPLLFN